MQKSPLLLPAESWGEGDPTEWQLSFLGLTSLTCTMVGKSLQPGLPRRRGICVSAPCGSVNHQQSSQMAS